MVCVYQTNVYKFINAIIFYNKNVTHISNAKHWW